MKTLDLSPPTVKEADKNTNPQVKGKWSEGEGRVGRDDPCPCGYCRPPAGGPLPSRRGMANGRHLGNEWTLENPRRLRQFAFGCNSPNG